MAVRLAGAAATRADEPGDSELASTWLISELDILAVFRETSRHTAVIPKKRIEERKRTEGKFGGVRVPKQRGQGEGGGLLCKKSTKV